MRLFYITLRLYVLCVIISFKTKPVILLDVTIGLKFVYKFTFFSWAESLIFFCHFYNNLFTLLLLSLSLVFRGKIPSLFFKFSLFYESRSPFPFLCSLATCLKLALKFLFLLLFCDPFCSVNHCLSFLLPSFFIKFQISPINCSG